MKDEILRGAGLDNRNGIKVLHIKGSPYQMGYQHGFLLAEEIGLMINRTLLATAAYVAAQTGSDTKRAEELLRAGQQEAEPHLPPELRQEMEGIADGAKGAGSDVTLSQVMLWNTNYDQWCIYCHPQYRQRDGSDASNSAGSAMTIGPAGGCSSFCAWDDWAGGDGRLIFGKNEDNFNMPEQLDSRLLVVADPSQGFGHAFMTYPGMVGLDGGLNESGMEMMTQLNSMQHESMKGCGIAVFTRLLLTYAGSLDQAIQIFRLHPGCAGIAYQLADAGARKAAVVETSSDRIAIRHPMPEVKALWQTNHSNCYPGWMGYSGYNMVADQAPVNELKDISTVEAWQNSLKDPYNFYVQAPSRFERYRQLIHEHYGRITPETAMKILSDRYDPYTRQIRPPDFPSWTNNILCTICALYPDFTYHAKEPLGTFRAHIANMWSMVAYPQAGDFWLAARGFPAQYGGYEHFNLKELLERMR
ncbi:MAG: hypothetical protein HPY61_10960 [Methanotrichaceae archaeon]|nr:hypothetical protein [Methanotrichaceae archaeon]